MGTLSLKFIVFINDLIILGLTSYLFTKQFILADHSFVLYNIAHKIKGDYGNDYKSDGK